MQQNSLAKMSPCIFLGYPNTPGNEINVNKAEITSDMQMDTISDNYFSCTSSISFTGVWSS